MAVTKWRDAVEAGEFRKHEIEAGAMALFAGQTDGLQGAEWAILPDTGREPFMQTSYLVLAGAKGGSGRSPVQIESDERFFYALCRDGTIWEMVAGAWIRVPDIPHG